jgi:hypothetical protein
MGDLSPNLEKEPGLRREAKRVVSDRDEDPRIRATSRLLLIGAVTEVPDIASGAETLGYGPEYVELRKPIDDLLGRTKVGKWVAVDGARDACEARLSKRIREKTIVWLIRGGQSSTWLEVGRFLEHQLQLKYTEFTDASAKRFLVTERVAQMAFGADLAVAVMSAEDKVDGGGFRARQNVIHEIGVAQGALGWERVIICREEGVESFTNMSGLVYISYKRDAVTASFDDLRQHIEARLR